MVRLMLLLGLIAGVVTAQEVSKGAEKIVGKWTVVSMINEKEKVPEEVAKSMSVTIDAKAITIQDATNSEKAEYRLDTSSKPWTLDLKPEKEPTAQVVGICELDGDTLKLAWNKGDPRPKDFKGEGKKETVLVLKRKK